MLSKLFLTSNRAASLVALAAASFLPSLARADLIDFEDAVPVNTYQIASGYKGFVWGGEAGAASWVLAQPANNFFTAHSGSNYAWSNGGSSLSMSGTVFDFTSMWAYGQNGNFGNGANLTARGYLNNVEIYSSTFSLGTSYSQVVLNFTGIDSIVFNDSPADYNLIIDDITVNASSVPDSASSVILLGLGLAGLGAFRRKFAGV